MTDTTPEPKVEITMRMGFPSVMSPASGDRNPCRIEISEETSGCRIFEFELDGQQLLDLLARRQVTPTVTWAHPHPERMGHEQIRWTEHFSSSEESDALAFRAALNASGWYAGDGPLTRSNSQAAKFTVTGRRWDGVQPGTYCREHRHLVLAGHVCGACAVLAP